MRYRALFCFIVTACAIVALSGTAHAAVIAHYTFDTDFTDSSASGNDLTTAAGTPTITSVAGEYVYGRGGLAIDSTTSTEEYLNLASPITFGGTDAWSISFWARRSSDSDNRQGMVLGDTSNTIDFIWLSNNPSQVRGLRFRNSDNVTSDFGVYEPDGDDFEYHHYAIIADGAGGITVYYDGGNAGTLSASGAFSITSVGAAYSATTHSLNGQMDELWIFNEAIDKNTVDSLYTTNTVPEPATMALLAVGAVAMIRRRRAA